MLNIRDFGAVADGKTVNTKAIQAAVDRAGETGETVLVPGGVFIVDKILYRVVVDIRGAL